MSDQTVHYRIHRIDDASVLEFLKELTRIGGETFQFDQKVNLSPYITLEPNRFLEISTGVGKFAIQSAFSSVSFSDGRGISINFRRAFHRENKFIATASWDEVSYLITGAFNLWEPFLPAILEIIELIARLDVAIDPPSLSEVMPDTLHETLRAITATHAQMMDRLNLALIDLANKRTELELGIAEKEAARKQELDRAKAELESERLALDKLSAKAARRRISQRIEEMAKEFGTSRKAFSSRTHGFGISVGLVAFAAGMVFAWISYSSVIAYSDMTVQIKVLNQLMQQGDRTDLGPELADISGSLNTSGWVLLFKSLVSGFVAAGAFTYAASWLRRYYQEDLGQAQELHRLNADVARASWVVEAIHEIQDEAKAELPPAWVEAVTRNLFGAQASRTQVDDAALALRALMGFSAGAKVGPNGAEFEIGRKGAKALSQSEE